MKATTYSSPDKLNLAYSKAICGSWGVKIKTQTFSCWDSVSDAFTFTPRSPFETSNIKVSNQPKCSISTSSSLEGSEKVRSLFEGVCLCCFSVYVLLIQLAFRSLINCHGIWLFWVNAITHAACSGNGCLPTAGPASTLPFFTLPLFSLLPFFVCWKGLFAHSQQEQTHDCGHPRSWQLRPKAEPQRSNKVAASSFFYLIYCKCVEIGGLQPFRPNFGLSL